MSKPVTVVRTITVQAPSERVRSLVNDFHEDSLIGPDVEKGLAKLKSAAESA